MLKLALILAFISIGYVQSTSFEETRDCLHGPEYWCQSVQNSKRCGAFKHCLQSVWSKHEKYLKSAQNDKSCDACLKCINGDYSGCDNVNIHLDEITDMFMAGIPSISICKLVKGCDTSSSKGVNMQECAKLHPRTWCDSIDNARICDSIDYCKNNIWTKLRPVELAKEYIKSDAVCGFCTWVFNKLHEILQDNATEIDIQQYLLGACSLIPSKDEQQTCTDAINKNFPQIYNLIRDSTDPGIICRVIKLCHDAHMVEKESKPVIFTNKISIKVMNPDQVIVTSPLQKQKKLLGSKTEVLVSKLVKTSGVGCEVCSLVLTAAKFMLQNKEAETETLDFVKEELCSRLGSLNSTCYEYIDTVGKEILEALVNNIDPSLLCHNMGLCLKIQVTSPDTKRFFDINVKDGSNCTICKLVMTEVKTMLSNKNEETQILEYIRQNLCAKVTQYEEMCKTVVNAYGPIILDFLAKDINPTQVCQIIGLCPSQTKEQEINKPEEVKKDNTPCVICEFVLTTLSKFVQQNSSVPEVEKVLDYICSNVMPSTIRGECKAFVSEYGPVIAQLLANEIQPDQICKFIGLCPKTATFQLDNKQMLEIMQKINKNTPQCAICEFLLTVLSKYVNQNSTAPEVEKWLEYVCKSVMPATIRTECSNFVQEYGPVIIELLSNEIQPDKICSFLKLCSSNEKAIISVDPVQVQNKEEVYCDVCQFVLQFIDYELANDKSQKSITKALENACKIAPESMRDKCNSIVSTYGEYLISLLLKYSEPLAVCNAIKLCSHKIDDIKKPIESIKQINLIPAEKLSQQNKNDRLKLPSQPAIGDLQCSLCLYVAEILDNLLKQNKTDQDIKNEIEKVCNLFPEPLKDQCKSFLDDYAIYVLELLANDLDPKEACEKLKLCTSMSQTSSYIDFRGLLKVFREKMTKRRN